MAFTIGKASTVNVFYASGTTMGIGEKQGSSASLLAAGQSLSSSGTYSTSSGGASILASSGGAMTASPSSATAAPSTSPSSSSSLMVSGEVNLPPSSPTSSQTSALPGFLCVTEKNLYWIRQHLAKYDGEKFSNVVKKKAVKMESVPQLEKYLKIMKNALPGTGFLKCASSPAPFLSLPSFFEI